jgi:hypothetical protein
MEGGRKDRKGGGREEEGWDGEGRGGMIETK